MTGQELLSATDYNLMDETEIPFGMTSSCWIREVVAEKTRLGYIDWVKLQIGASDYHVKDWISRVEAHDTHLSFFDWVNGQYKERPKWHEEE